MSPRQETRAGRLYLVACQKLQEELDSGAKLRTDGFFDAIEGRAAADEVLEAAIRAAMEASQEQKVDFIGALWARLAINPRIDVATAHMLLECARGMSFRGYVLLKISAEKAALALPVRGGENDTGPSEGLQPLMVEIYDLTRRGLLVMKDVGDPNAYAILGHDDVDPARLSPSVVGQLLYENLDLHRMDQDDTTYRQTFAGLKALAQSGRGATKIDGGIDDGTF